MHKMHEMYEMSSTKEKKTMKWTNDNVDGKSGPFQNKRWDDNKECRTINCGPKKQEPFVHGYTSMFDWDKNCTMDKNNLNNNCRVLVSCVGLQGAV